MFPVLVRAFPSYCLILPDSHTTHLESSFDNKEYPDTVTWKKLSQESEKKDMGYRLSRNGLLHLLIILMISF